MNTNKKSYGDFAAGTPKDLTEDLNKFTAAFRALWYSNRTMRFRDWNKEIEDLLDLLN